MTYVYAAMWFAVACILVFRMGRENRVFYAAGGFFFLLGAWWLADAILPENLFAGNWGLALKGITAIALILMSVAYYRETKKTKEAESHSGKSGDDPK